MKRILLIFVLLLITTIVFAGELTVLDYYKLLTKDVLKTGKFEITNKNGKYFTNSNADYEFEVIVDIKNKYLEIEDQGTGGGTTSQQFAIFLRSGQNPVFGLYESKFDGIDVESQIKFYEYTNKKWIDVTKKIIPEPSFSLFFETSDNETNQLIKEFTKYIYFTYNIPRYGTTMRCYLNSYKIEQLADSENKTNETKNAQKLNNLIKYNTIEYLWDYKKGIFTLGKKLKEKY